jgi:hypothetical protein
MTTAERSTHLNQNGGGMADTLGEKYFERFCNLRGMRWRRIRPAQKEGHKRPDYAIWVEGVCCVVEVKQLDRNAEDIRQQKELKERGLTIRKEPQPGRRVRGKITDASDQLRRFVRRGVAGMLVLFDGTRSLHYLDEYSVMAGMYGLDVLEIELVHGRTSAWQASSWKSGGKEKITPRTNTSISAVAVLNIGHDQELYLVLYHNEYAAICLHAHCAAGITDHQFVREVRRPEGINVWRHAISGEVLT